MEEPTGDPTILLLGAVYLEVRALRLAALGLVEESMVTGRAAQALFAKGAGDAGAEV